MGIIINNKRLDNAKQGIIDVVSDGKSLVGENNIADVSAKANIYNEILPSENSLGGIINDVDPENPFLPTDMTGQKLKFPLDSAANRPMSSIADDVYFLYLLTFNDGSMIRLTAAAGTNPNRRFQGYYDPPTGNSDRIWIIDTNINTTDPLITELDFTNEASGSKIVTQLFYNTGRETNLFPELPRQWLKFFAFDEPASINHDVKEL